MSKENMKNILVTGGAGYIGSHIVKLLAEQGYNPVVLDSLVTGHISAVHKNITFIRGDIADSLLVENTVKNEKIDAVIHLAARSIVSESIQQPSLYFQENTIKSICFINSLVNSGVKKIIFSSTAAVYGIPQENPIKESTPCHPINPYGISKMLIEKYLSHTEKCSELKWIALRYFNATGAALDGSIGEDHTPETHLIPLILKTALKQHKQIEIFGTDYQTPDGTCIRDYVHVLDIANAHIAALNALEREDRHNIYNIGAGLGYSVKEIIDIAHKITGQPITSASSPRRNGDPDCLVPSVDLIQSDLRWEPQYSSIEQIIESAWKWHKNHPNRYTKGK